MTLFGMELSPAKRKKAQFAQQEMLYTSILHNTEIQEESKNTQKGNLEIARQNYYLNEKLASLVAENKRTENILLEREQNIRISEEKIREQNNDIEERQNEVRKLEYLYKAREAEIRSKEAKVSSYEKDVEKREAEAKESTLEASKTKEKYQEFFEEIESQKDNITHLEKEAARKNREAIEKEKISNSIFERAKMIDEEIKEKEEKFEIKRAEIENSLNEKIAEYDRKLADMECVEEFVKGMKFDKSKEGKQAKIVVKEAIRQAKKQLGDIKTQFDELDEKYCSGTFKGFCIPDSEIDYSFEELRTEYQVVKEHLDASASLLPKCVYKWLEAIEEYMDKAAKNKKSWTFSEAYRNIIFGLASCKNYELLTNILNESLNNNNASEEDNHDSQKDDSDSQEFENWYEILEVSKEATQDEIKRAFMQKRKKYHPDKCEQTDENKEMYFKIKKAYEILSDENKREKFDEKLNNHAK
jgi:DnaJ-class molecular chaperone with C-terminal Zn finger domain